MIDRSGVAVGWIPLTENLGEALRALRDSPHIKHKIFWIDQICINQLDDEEKSSQVAMMSKIYTRAVRVILYVGPAGPPAREHKGLKLLKRIQRNVTEEEWEVMYGLGSLERIHEQFYDGSLVFFQLDADLEMLPDEEYSEEEILKRYHEQGWEWLISVTFGDWTRRLWIVQEQLLNHKVVALRGHDLLNWDALASIPFLFAVGYLPECYRDIWFKDVAEEEIEPGSIANALYGTWWERRNRKALGKDAEWVSGLLPNLQWYSGLRCEDPRDRVYGVLAVSSDRHALAIEPDYSASNTIEALSKDVSVAIFVNGGDLWPLSVALEWRRLQSGLPSWCINVDCPRETDSEVMSPSQYEPHPITVREPVGRFDENDNILILKGRILDTIATTPDSAIDSVHLESGWSFLASIVNMLSVELSHDYIANVHRCITSKENWTLPVDGLGSDGEVAAYYLTIYHRTAQEEILKELEEGPSPGRDDLQSRCSSIIENLSPFLPAWGNDLPEETKTATEAIGEKVDLHTLDVGRIIGATSSGRCFNAMRAIRGGDAIAALQGSDRLYLLRPAGDLYSLVGDIYVDGLMNGESYEGLEPDEVDGDISLV